MCGKWIWKVELESIYQLGSVYDISIYLLIKIKIVLKIVKEQ